MDEQRLYGLPFAEVMHFDAATVYEQVECDGASFPITIEEWSVHPPIYHVPSANRILDWLTEWIADNGEVFEDSYDQFEAATKKPDVVAAVENLRSVLASKITFRMAAHHLRDLVVTLDEADEPLLDGKPMYVDARGQKGAEGEHG
jgi:hypothetical protein